MAVGGDITAVTFSHPTIGVGAFYPVAGQGNTFDPGGVRADDNASGITTNGTPIFILNFVRGNATILLENDGLRKDSYKAAELAGSPQNTVFKISVINGDVYKITGRPVGDINPDVNASTFSMKISGGIVEKIA